jgi:hypothetical protein
MDFIYCDECHRHHDRTEHTDEPVVADQAKRHVKDAWATSAHHRPDPTAAKGSLARVTGSRSAAGGSGGPSPTPPSSERPRGTKRP